MVYKANIPQGTDPLSTSQVDMLENFGQLNTQFSVDHDSLDVVADGFHKKVSFKSDGNQAVPAGAVSVEYTNTVGGNSELHFRNGVNTVQITSAALPIWKGGTVGGTGVVTTTAAQNGYMTLPNGLIMQWGLATGITAPGSGTINFPTAYSSAAWQVFITPIRNSSNVDTVYFISATTTQFTYRNTASGITSFNWFAIGPA